VKKPLKILYFNPVQHFGGAEAVLVNLINGLDKCSFEPVVITGNTGTFTEALDRFGISRYGIRPVQSAEAGIIGVLINFIPNLIRIGQIIDREKPDLIHDMTHDGFMYLSIWAKLKKVPLIWQPHIPWEKVRKQGRVLQKIFASVKLDFIIFVNQFARNSYGSFSRPPWKIIHNSIDLKAYRRKKTDRLRKKHDFPRNASLVGLVARIVPGKGHDVFIETAGLLSQNENNIRFLIIGDPHIDVSFTRELQKIIRKRGLEETVRFTGFLSPPEEFLPCLDVLVMPSRSELQGLVLLEAMACGVPIVASDLEATRELIVHGVTGLLVPPGAGKLFARSILKMIEDDELRKKTTANALLKIRTDHSLKKNIRHFTSIYRILCLK